MSIDTVNMLVLFVPIIVLLLIGGFIERDRRIKWQGKAEHYRCNADYWRDRCYQLQKPTPPAEDAQ